MAEFVYQSWRNPYVNSISALMEQQGKIQGNALQQNAAAQAQAALTSGNAWAGAAQQTGQAVAGAIQQATDPRRKLESLQAQERQAQITDHDKFKEILSKTPQIEENGMHLYDLPSLGEQSVQAGIDPSPYLVEYGKVNDAFRAESNARQATIQTAAQALAKAPDPDLAKNFLGAAVRNRTIDEATAARLGGMIDAAETPEAKAAVVQKIAITYAGNQPGIKLAGAQRPGAAPETLINPLTHEVIATGATAAPAPPKPEANVVYKDEAGIEHPVMATGDGKYIYNGQDVTADVTRPAPPKPHGEVREGFVIKGTTNVPTYHPDTDTWSFAGKPVAADQVLRAAPPKDPIALAIERSNLAMTNEKLDETKRRKGNVDAIVQGMKDGTIPPDPEGLSRQGVYADVIGQMARDGVDFADLRKNWLAAKRLIVTENSPQANRLDTAVRSGLKMYDAIDALSSQWEGMGLGPLSRANLKAAMEGMKGKAAADLAIQLNGQIAQLTSDVATVEQNGMTPTTESRHVAAESMQSWWGDSTIKKMTIQGRANMKIRDLARRESVPLVPGQNTAPAPEQWVPDGKGGYKPQGK